MKVSKELLLEALQTKVNSALLNLGNHEADNSFLESNLDDFAKNLEEYQYEPLGICRNVPFKNTDVLAFAIKDTDGNVYWCHLAEMTWFTLIYKELGYDKAGELFEKLLKKRG